MNIPTSIYDFKMNNLTQGVVDFSDFKDKKILIVNVASECGLTPQYSQLQELHDLYKNDLIIIGVPANNFGAQEPGTHETIAQFCSKNYGVTFLMTEKVDVIPPNQHPLYTWLTNKEYNKIQDSEVKWNFQKYLIDEKGNLAQVIAPTTEVVSEEFLAFLS